MNEAQTNLLQMIIEVSDRIGQDAFVTSSGGNSLRALERRGLVTYSTIVVGSDGYKDRYGYIAAPTAAGRQAVTG